MKNTALTDINVTHDTLLLDLFKKKPQVEMQLNDKHQFVFDAFDPEEEKDAIEEEILGAIIKCLVDSEQVSKRAEGLWKLFQTIQQAQSIETKLSILGAALENDLYDLNYSDRYSMSKFLWFRASCKTSVYHTLRQSYDKCIEKYQALTKKLNFIP